MTVKVGVFAANLRDAKPRGVQRVARALAERLAALPGLEVYALGGPSFERVGILAEHWRLEDYLRQVPLRLPTAKDIRRRRDEERARAAGDRWDRPSRPGAAPVPALALPAALVAGALGKGTRRRVRQAYKGTLRRLRLLAPPTPAPSLDAMERAVRPLGPIALDRLDVIVAFEPFEAIWDWPVELLRAKALGIAHDLVPLRVDEGPYWRPDHFYRAVGKFALRADRIVCVSAATEADLHSFFPTAAGKTVVVHHGHDLARFAPRADGAATRAPGVPGRRRVLMVGDIDRRKNVQTALRAMPSLARRLRGSPLELVVIGNDHQRAHFEPLERLARAAGAEVSWTGYVQDEELAELYRTADVFLYPSLWEGFGIPVLEAMTAGLPVVCSDLSSLPEVGGDHALYCDPWDPASIARALERALLMEPGDRERWVAAARAWAAGFTWDRAAEGLRAAILDLAAAAKPTSGPSGTAEPPPGAGRGTLSAAA